MINERGEREPSAMTLPQVASLTAVSREVATSWVRAGELKAFDASRPGSKVRAWRLFRKDLDAFIARRSNVQAAS